MGITHKFITTILYHYW